MTTLTQIVNIGENQPCLSFQDSLGYLHIDCDSGAYGVKCNKCSVYWKRYQREGWLKGLLNAQSEIQRDLGKAICPMEICNETHYLTSSGELTLNQKPIAYLGLAEYGDWTEVTLVADGDDLYFNLCESELPAGLTPDDIQVSYPDAILACYRGLQTLQFPCVEDEDDCDGGGNPGWKLSWPKYQLMSPLEDEADPNDTADNDKFLTNVKWRVITINSDLAVEGVGSCSCNCCSTKTYTATIVDANEGIICITPSSGCSCSKSRERVRINYAVGMDCFGRDSSLLLAISLRALVLVGSTPSKPCGCDNGFVEGMLKIDPTATTEFATKLRYGPTVAGMEAMRIVEKYLRRPNFNEPVQNGGLLQATRGIKALPF